MKTFSLTNSAPHKQPQILLGLLFGTLIFCCCTNVVQAQVNALAENARVDVRPIVRVAAEHLAQTDRLRLADVAEIKTADTNVIERLRAISLGFAPNVGIIREIPRERLQLALAAAGFAEGTVRIEAPPVLIIKRAAQIIDHALVQEAIEKAALSELNTSGATARMARLELPPTIEAPAGKLEIRAAMVNVRDIFSPFTIFVEFWQEGRIVHRCNALAQVEAHAPVVVAARELSAQTRLRADAVVVEVRKLTRPLNNYVTNAEYLRGMALRRAVGRGEVIIREDLNSEIVVRSGDQVRIIGESGSGAHAIQVFVTGEARSAGRIGDRIQVKNLQSGVMLQAVITDEGIVRIRF